MWLWCCIIVRPQCRTTEWSCWWMSEKLGCRHVATCIVRWRSSWRSTRLPSMDATSCECATSSHARTTLKGPKHGGHLAENMLFSSFYESARDLFFLLCALLSVLMNKSSYQHGCWHSRSNTAFDRSPSLDINTNRRARQPIGSTTTHTYSTSDPKATSLIHPRQRKQICEKVWVTYMVSKLNRDG